MSKKLREFLQAFVQKCDSFGHGCGLFRFLVGGALTITAAEFFNPTGGVNNLLLAGKEGVTGGADFHMEFGSG